MKQRADKHPPKTITPQRLRLFKIIAVCIPIFFLCLLEFCLWIFHYGPDLSPFTVETINGKSYYTLNPSVKNRYFSRINFSPDPSPEYFLVSKPPGTFRIFCLGGSTTVGYPYWYNGAFSSFLRDRLKVIFPDRPIEIINLGMTATNSYTVLDLSDDLMKYNPDLFIVYDGHNEFYGVLGVASNDRVAPARWMTLLYLRMIHLRTFQLIKHTMDELLSFLGKAPIDYSSHSTMMEQVAQGKNVPYGNDIYAKSYTVFEQNLKDLADRCRDRRIPLFLSTQVSNIRNQFPFISNHSPNISEQQRSQFEQSYKSASELQSKGILDSAIILYKSAIGLDTLYADAHYRLAQCLDAQGKKHEAYPEYILARDYDELRFRTDSKFNNLIRSMEDSGHCFIVDIEKTFKCLSQDSLIGHDFIFEHLHPNALGHFFIAKEYAMFMRKHNLLASPEEWAKHDTVTDDFLWQHRHVTEVDEFLAARKTEFLTSRWPFKSPPSTIMPIKGTDTLRFIAEQAARNQISWVTAHEHAAEYYMQHHDFINTEKEYETIMSQFPLDVTAYLKLAQLCFMQKDFQKAEKILLASLQVQQTAFANRILGDISIKQKRPEKAIHYYEELSKFLVPPAVSAENTYMLAYAYLLAEKPEPAIRMLQQTINRYPTYQPAKELLAKVKMIQNTHPAK